MSFTIPVWTFPEENGYQPKTTFWMDFSIADHFGPRAVRDTFNRAFREWRENHEYLTELSLVLNHKAWAWNNRDDALCQLYCRLYDRVDSWGRNHLKGEMLDYYLTTID
jgi:hypothetical protein